METRRVKIEIAILKFYQLFHCVLSFLIILCHIISVNKYLLIFNSLVVIFYFSMIIYSLNLFFLLISSIFMFTKKSSPTLINLFKNITKVLLILTFLKGLSLTIMLWINYYHFPKFIKFCPFNFSLNNLIKLIKNNKEKNITKKNCALKRCIFDKYSNDNISNKFIYLCNFNPEYDMYNIHNNIDCYYVTQKEYIDTKFYFYFEKCNTFSNFYKCFIKEKKHDKYFVKFYQKCPYSFKKKRYITLGILFPFIDLIADSIIWIFIYSQYTRILKFINFQFVEHINRLSPSSLNSTKESSIIKQNNNINRNIFAQININQTEMIIYPPLDNNNIHKVNNNKKKIYFYNNNISLTDSNLDLISNNNTTINKNI